MTTQVRLPVCCARVAALVTMEEANLARLARRAAKREAAGLSTVVLRRKIDESKTAVAEAKQRVIDHDADHAGGGL